MSACPKSRRVKPSERHARSRSKFASNNVSESDRMQANLGIAPIAWWNDDLPELSDDVSLEECLSQARQPGFPGRETGRRFPMEAAVLRPILERHGMRVCGGWFS